MSRRTTTATLVVEMVSYLLLAAFSLPFAVAVGATGEERESSEQQQGSTTTLTTTLTTTTTSLLYASQTPPPSSSSSYSSSSSSPLPPPTLSIVQSHKNFAYAGCWTETYTLAHTNGLRALDGGVEEARPGEMTVDFCLAFCADAAFSLAGLEYSRECWCSNHLNSLSERVDDALCDTPCDGANTTACGGSLRLSLYNSTVGVGGDKNSSAAAVTAGKGRGMMMMMMLVVGVLGFAVWGW